MFHIGTPIRCRSYHSGTQRQRIWEQPKYLNIHYKINSHLSRRYLKLDSSLNLSVFTHSLVLRRDLFSICDRRHNSFQGPLQLFPVFFHTSPLLRSWSHLDRGTLTNATGRHFPCGFCFRGAPVSIETLRAIETTIKFTISYLRDLSLSCASYLCLYGWWWKFFKIAVLYCRVENR